MDNQDKICLKTWMENLPDFLKATPLVRLAIPGSHNSFTYSLKRWSAVSPDAPAIVRTLSHIFMPIANPIIYNWSKTQNTDVQKQLDIGIRYLDIRLVCRNKKIYVAHGLYGGKFHPFLNDIFVFLSTNTKEVLILDLQHFYEFTEADHAGLLTVLDTAFGDKVFKRSQSVDIGKVCLKDFEQASAQILIIYRCSAANSSQIVWPSSAWPTYWPDTTNIDDLIAKLNNALARRISTKGFVSQFILTVDVPYVLRHITSRLKNLSVITRQYLLSWVLSQIPGSHGVNVIICDFVDEEFASTVIKLNFKQNALVVPSHPK